LININQARYIINNLQAIIQIEQQQPFLELAEYGNGDKEYKLNSLTEQVGPHVQHVW